MEAACALAFRHHGRWCLDGAAAGDQARVMTPGEAQLLGADAIVMGRPITESSDPRRVVEAVLAELAD